MRRFPDWPQRLYAAIEQRRRLPHAWGSNDCALMAADLVRAMTGEDFGAPFRGRYSDADGARAILAALGHPDLASLADSFLPRLERPRRGDVLLLPSRNGDYLAIAHSSGAIGPGPTGVEIVSRIGLKACWGVG